MLSMFAFEQLCDLYCSSAARSRSPKEIIICSGCNSIGIIVSPPRIDAVPGIIIEPL